MTSQKGFTLVELIASLVLAGILAIALTTIILIAVNGFFLAKDASDIAQKSQLAILRIRAELICITDIQSAGPDKVVFTNTNGNYEIERTDDLITLKKTGSAPIPAKPLTNGIETAFYTLENQFLVYQKSGTVSWNTTDDINELEVITVTLKFSDHFGVFQTTITPRLNRLRNAPKLVYRESSQLSTAM